MKFISESKEIMAIWDHNHSTLNPNEVKCELT